MSQSKFKYIFFTGAPGSNWSGVAKTFYWSPDIDQSDYQVGTREYKDPSSTNPDIGPHHTGAYWDPGMEFDLWDWDSPFSGNGIRLIKSHCLAKHLNEVKEKHPDCPIVMVWRNDEGCALRWYEAGGWNISYPNYAPYYQNDEKMAEEIHLQNEGIAQFIMENMDHVTQVYDVKSICKELGIAQGPEYNPIYPTEYIHELKNSAALQAHTVKIFVYYPPTLCEEQS